MKTPPSRPATTPPTTTADSVATRARGPPDGARVTGVAGASGDSGAGAGAAAKSCGSAVVAELCSYMSVTADPRRVAGERADATGPAQLRIDLFRDTLEHYHAVDA